MMVSNFQHSFEYTLLELEDVLVISFSGVMSSRYDSEIESCVFRLKQSPFSKFILSFKNIKKIDAFGFSVIEELLIYFLNRSCKFYFCHLKNTDIEIIEQKKLPIRNYVKNDFFEALDLISKANK